MHSLPSVACFSSSKLRLESALVSTLEGTNPMGRAGVQDPAPYGGYRLAGQGTTCSLQINLHRNSILVDSCFPSSSTSTSSIEEEMLTGRLCERHREAVQHDARS
ncbi:hypothetical protein NX059_012524 [Plenodomus lindquistii]|nr:hypothetical protein NX059_012524 [Plenodomus lindquistii]